MPINGLALMLAAGLGLGSAVLFPVGALLGRWDVMKTAVVLGVLGFVTFLLGRVVGGVAFLLLAVLVFAAVAETIRYYEPG